mmetsp:Transcript_10143/g.19143  ORF Transcript_10143/g.19143 Transcript_10143/m.19143 type:complete len:99 (-) Transcript_10143:631-927(-)
MGEPKPALLDPMGCRLGAAGEPPWEELPPPAPQSGAWQAPAALALQREQGRLAQAGQHLQHAAEVLSGQALPAAVAAAVAAGVIVVLAGAGEGAAWDK